MNIGFYIGEFDKNKKNGKGTIYYKNGSILNGIFLNDEIDGEGYFIK